MGDEEDLRFGRRFPSQVSSLSSAKIIANHDPFHVTKSLHGDAKCNPGRDSCTAVRIPTSRAHSESIVALFDKPVDVAAARKALEDAPGVKLVDDPEKLEYPMPLTATGQYDVEVGRIRKNIAFDNALEFFVCGDQLLRGAALNAVIVAEAMLENGALKSKVAA